jgi:hypothetical protein
MSNPHPNHPRPAIATLVAAAERTTDEAARAPLERRGDALRGAASAWRCVAAELVALAAEADDEAALERGRRSRLLPEEARREGLS